jgi:hypothetical protein
MCIERLFLTIVTRREDTMFKTVEVRGDETLPSSDSIAVRVHEEEPPLKEVALV